MEQATIAIFASGSGSNAARIMDYFKTNSRIRVGVVLCNNPQAGVLSIARTHGIEAVLFNKEEFYHTQTVLNILKEKGITHIVLAGFLWLIPAYLLDAYPNRMVNIHPALLPKFGGKGMYGKHVHQAVKEAAESVTGITIHLVNSHYDEGTVILQEKTPLEGNETPEEIGLKVQLLEHAFFAPTIEKWILSTI